MSMTIEELTLAVWPRKLAEHNVLLHFALQVMEQEGLLDSKTVEQIAETRLLPLKLSWIKVDQTGSLELAEQLLPDTLILYNDLGTLIHQIAPEEPIPIVMLTESLLHHMTEEADMVQHKLGLEQLNKKLDTSFWRHHHAEVLDALTVLKGIARTVDWSKIDPRILRDLRQSLQKDGLTKEAHAQDRGQVLLNAFIQHEAGEEEYGRLLTNLSRKRKMFVTKGLILKVIAGLLVTIGAGIGLYYAPRTVWLITGVFIGHNVHVYKDDIELVGLLLKCACPFILDKIKSYIPRPSGTSNVQVPEAPRTSNRPAFPNVEDEVQSYMNRSE